MSSRVGCRYYLAHLPLPAGLVGRQPDLPAVPASPDPVKQGRAGEGALVVYQLVV